ncbi:MAG: hypothetical protein HN350_02760 [Phycisphaerales bacterium]|jgi:predicted DNA-binding protein (UPF0251 family)|nr:hypothetical protein [Phycisphaerales bacterium]
MRSKKQLPDNAIGFRCTGPECGQWVGDVRYVGPMGHAPRNLCFECWVEHWERVEAIAMNGGRWTDIDEALWLVCHGLTFSQAADIITINRKTLHRWITKMRRQPDLIPGWLIHKNEVLRQTISQAI